MHQASETIPLPAGKWANAENNELIEGNRLGIGVCKSFKYYIYSRFFLLFAGHESMYGLRKF